MPNGLVRERTWLLVVVIAVEMFGRWSYAVAEREHIGKTAFEPGLK